MTDNPVRISPPPSKLRATPGAARVAISVRVALAAQRSSESVTCADGGTGRGVQDATARTRTSVSHRAAGAAAAAARGVVVAARPGSRMRPDGDAAPRGCAAGAATQPGALRRATGTSPPASRARRHLADPRAAIIIPRHGAPAPCVAVNHGTPSRGSLHAHHPLDRCPPVLSDTVESYPGKGWMG